MARIRRAQVQARVRVVSSTQSIQAADDVLFADAAAGGFSLTLPLSTAFPGRLITIKKIDTINGNNVSILTSGGENIDGSSSLSLFNQYDHVSLVSRAPAASGPHWAVIGG